MCTIAERYRVRDSSKNVFLKIKYKLCNLFRDSKLLIQTLLLIDFHLYHIFIKPIYEKSFVRSAGFKINFKKQIYRLGSVA